MRPSIAPVRRPISHPMSAASTDEVSVTANPSHVPNSRPLAAASSGPGTRMQPSSALTTAKTGAPQFPSGSIQDCTSSCETTRRTPKTTKSTSSTAARSASRMRVVMPAGAARSAVKPG